MLSSIYFIDFRTCLFKLFHFPLHSGRIQPTPCSSSSFSPANSEIVILYCGVFLSHLLLLIPTRFRFSLHRRSIFFLLLEANRITEAPTTTVRPEAEFSCLMRRDEDDRRRLNGTDTPNAYQVTWFCTLISSNSPLQPDGIWMSCSM